MKFLAIETSAAACSVAVNINGNITEDYRLAPREHNQILLPMVEELMSNAELAIKDLNAIAFGCGPGSFTGVRIAAAVTQGLAISHDIPVMPISSLLVLAQTAWQQQHVDKIFVCVDARIGDVYRAECGLNSEKNIMELMGEEQCLKPTEIQFPMDNQDKVIVVGDGWSAYPELLQQQSRIQYLEDIHPHASALAKLAQFSEKRLPAAEALPTYLRKSLY